MDVVRWPRLDNCGDGQNIHIDSSPYCIGRSLNSNFVIGSKLISKEHCVFAKTNQGWTVTDKSTNGTFVNNIPLKKNTSPLKEGDQITLTAQPFVYRILGIDPPPLVVPADDEITDDQLCDLANQVENLEARPPAVVIEQPVPEPIMDPPVQELGEPSPKKRKVDTAEVMDDELTCSICSELFVKAVTLNCSHSFCKFCIETWQKNKSMCPICRTKITKANLTLVLDNFINKMLEKASDEVKEERKRLVDDRAKEEEKRAKTGRRKTTRRAEEANHLNPVVVIDLSDQDTDEDINDDEYSDYFGDDSDMDIDDLPNWDHEYVHDDWYDNDSPLHSYYGGYGACYTCGEAGHWANACPNRNRRRN